MMKTEMVIGSVALKNILLRYLKSFCLHLVIWDVVMEVAMDALNMDIIGLQDLVPMEKNCQVICISANIPKVWEAGVGLMATRCVVSRMTRAFYEINISEDPISDFFDKYKLVLSM